MFSRTASLKNSWYLERKILMELAFSNFAVRALATLVNVNSNHFVFPKILKILSEKLSIEDLRKSTSVKPYQKLFDI